MAQGKRTKRAQLDGILERGGHVGGPHTASEASKKLPVAKPGKETDQLPEVDPEDQVFELGRFFTGMARSIRIRLFVPGGNPKRRPTPTLPSHPESWPKGTSPAPIRPTSTNAARPMSKRPGEGEGRKIRSSKVRSTRCAPG